MLGLLKRSVQNAVNIIWSALIISVDLKKPNYRPLLHRCPNGHYAIRSKYVLIEID